MGLPKITKLLIGTADLTSEIGTYTFYDRGLFYEYSIVLPNYFTITPFSKDVTVFLEINNETVFGEDNQPMFEMTVNDNGTTIRLRKEK